MNLMKCPNGHHYDASPVQQLPLLRHGRCERWAGSDDGSFGRPGVSAGSQRSD